MSSMNLYVGNLAFQTTESQLKSVFAQCGEVLSAQIISDRYSGQSRGFGFVEMSSRNEGEKSINELNGKLIDDRQIKVSEAKPRAERSSRNDRDRY